MSLQLESAEERLKYQEPILGLATISQCDGKTTVFYNGQCQRRNNPCHFVGGKALGYLGQASDNPRRGVCIDFGTRAPKTPVPKGVNPPTTPKVNPPIQGTANCPSDCNHEKAYTQINRCGKCTRLELDYRLFAQRQSGAPATPSSPKSSAPTKCPAGDVDCDCNDFPLGKGLCVLGKQITKGITGVGVSAGNWAQNPVAQFMPVMLVGGGIVLLAIMIKGR